MCLCYVNVILGNSPWIWLVAGGINQVIRVVELRISLPDLQEGSVESGTDGQ